MKSIIMVSDMNCENCANKIETALRSANVTCSINLDNKIVVVEGNNDMVRNAKQIINDIGFTVV